MVLVHSNMSRRSDTGLGKGGHRFGGKIVEINVSTGISQDHPNQTLRRQGAPGIALIVVIRISVLSVGCPVVVVIRVWSGA
jgi:hypothetical protein